jgi:hypothetical protein
MIIKKYLGLFRPHPLARRHNLASHSTGRGRCHFSTSQRVKVIANDLPYIFQNRQCDPIVHVEFFQNVLRRYDENVGYSAGKTPYFIIGNFFFDRTACPGLLVTRESFLRVRDGRQKCELPLFSVRCFHLYGHCPRSILIIWSNDSK